MKRVIFCHKCIYGIFEESQYDKGAKVMVGCQAMTPENFKKFVQVPFCERECPMMRERKPHHV